MNDDYIKAMAHQVVVFAEQLKKENADNNLIEKAIQNYIQTCLFVSATGGK